MSDFHDTEDERMTLEVDHAKSRQRYHWTVPRDRVVRVVRELMQGPPRAQDVIDRALEVLGLPAPLGPWTMLDMPGECHLTSEWRPIE